MPISRDLRSFALTALAAISILFLPGIAKAQNARAPFDRASLVERDGQLLDPQTGQPVTGTIIERHPNGRLSKRYDAVDGRAHGAWLEWFETGAVRLYIEWKRGLGDGVWVYFYPNGEIRSRGQVADDIWNGIDEGWHDNGVKAYEGRFDLGVRPLPSRRWDVDGNAVGPWIELVGGPERRSVLAEGWPQGLTQWDFSFSPDLETVFVATGLPDGSGRQVLIRRFRNGAWMAPEPAPFADPGASEGTPFVSPDGRHVYFSSDRHRSTEPGNPNRDFYRASAASGWRTVERVTNTPAYGEVSLSLNAAGDGVLWTGRRIDGVARMGLYQVRYEDRGSAPMITVVGDLNDLHTGDPSNENSAAISPDGRHIVFANYDLEGKGSDEDLYVVCRTDGGWSPPVSLGAGVNSPGTDSSPQFLNDGATLAWRYDGSEGQEIRIIAMSAATNACQAS